MEKSISERIKQMINNNEKKERNKDEKLKKNGLCFVNNIENML